MIIAFTGKAGSGKDEACSIISQFGSHLPVERVAFADPLKRFVANTLGISVRDVECMKLQNRRFMWLWLGGLRFKRMSMRSLLQRVGTEGGREVFGDSFWIDQSLPADLDHSNRLIVITDLRFPNEAQRVMDLDGFVMRIDGPTTIKRASLLDRIMRRQSRESQHASENADWSQGLRSIDNSVRDDCYSSLISQIGDLLRDAS